ncbi:hypothetical protein M9H77_19975 [Catharanthus roseus]|uniref:Uncharacterized protein n=1 Tax=Catharanthus roseus TaxID=4058 RepID=A0ACC0AJN4_CATRO|nr:hypothetical protein M9H77_19975 [Catharanthus roseus]
MSNSFIPEDLLLNILARLPVESLLRFRCISKSWAAIIDSKEFTKFHLNLSIKKQESHKFLFIKRWNIYAAEFYSSKNIIANWRQISNPFSKPHVSFNLVGSCNGLLCIHDVLVDNLFLYNPWTKKTWIVPLDHEDIDSFPTKVSHGFGYDDINDDYKIVRISNYCEVKVYSLKLNSWKRVEGFPYTISYTCNNGVLSNGSLHWLPYWKDKSNLNRWILAIDLRTDKYRLVPLPEIKEKYEMGRLGVLNGCDLSLVIQTSSHVLTWIMKDYGIKDSWRNIMRIESNDLMYLLVQPLAYFEIRKQLIYQDSKGFISYDIERKLQQRIDIDHIQEVSNNNAYCCVPSLVQPFSGERSKGSFGHRKRKRDT